MHIIFKRFNMTKYTNNLTSSCIAVKHSQSLISSLLCSLLSWECVCAFTFNRKSTTENQFSSISGGLKRDGFAAVFVCVCVVLTDFFHFLLLALILMFSKLNLIGSLWQKQNNKATHTHAHMDEAYTRLSSKIGFTI